MSATIKAAYNFVPVEKNQQYFKPDLDWVNQVSHDLPFSDGVCGEITLKITAQTPLAIKDNNDSKSFPTLSNGEKFIPATTIKGMIRSVLEILSFGHLDGSRVQDSHVTYRHELEYAKTTHCGWLQRDGHNRAKIFDWGIPAAIKRCNLNTSEVQCDFKDLDLFGKYKTLNLHGEQSFIEDGVLKDSGRKLFKIGRGSKTGHIGYIVYTGKTIGSRADREFVFLKPQPHQRVDSHDIGEDLLKKYDNLFEIYKKNNRSEEIQKNKDLRCPSHRDGYEPVFFTLDKGGNIVSIGNVLLHKDYTQYSVYDAIPKQLRQPKRGKDIYVDRPDLADIIFGTTNPKCTMRGRVQFGHGFQCDLEKKINIEIKNAILAEPKISFFNTYLQSGDWKKVPSLIAGRKRYPIRKVLLPLEIPEPKEQEDKRKKENNAGTSFQTIPSGSTFKTTIRFHNLRGQELGALLSAITFHGNCDCYHSMGQAKAYGYGSVKVEIDNFDPIPNKGDGKTISCYMTQFKELMINKFDGSWLQSTAIKELFAMARGVGADQNILFESIKLSDSCQIWNDKKNKYESKNVYRELKLSKNDTTRLTRFSDILKNGNTPNNKNSSKQNNRNYNKTNNQPVPEKSQAVEVEGVLNTDPRYTTRGDNRIWIEVNKTYKGYVPHGGCFIVNDKKWEKKASYDIKGKKINDYKKEHVNIKVTKISDDRNRITVEIIKREPQC